jgi:hypothetical protein
MIITKQIPDYTISPDRFAEYWGDITAYSQEEIAATLTEAHDLKAEHDKALGTTGALLDYDPIWNRLPETLYAANSAYLNIVNDEPCITNRTRSTAHEPFPVKEWQRQMAKARRQLTKLHKLDDEIKSILQAQPAR